MIILAIDTSCDETAAAITDGVSVLSNIIWSQASLYAEFGGVMPTVAQRQHRERIDWVVEQAIKKSGHNITEIDAIAVTVGPGLSIALAVGIQKAKQLAQNLKLPLIPVNHIEGHLLSPFVNNKNKIEFPALGLVTSGGTTILCLINDIGKYETLAKTQDDALGEALDKAARLLGLGYPGGAILEKFARLGNKDKYPLPVPLIEDKDKYRFSYSGIKSALVRLFNSIKKPTKQDLYDLAVSFQNVAFKHVENVLEYQIQKQPIVVQSLLFGGGVVNNIEIRKRVRLVLKRHNIKLHIPYSKKLLGDNAAMIGVCAYLKSKDVKNLKEKYSDLDINYDPKLSL